MARERYSFSWPPIATGLISAFRDGYGFDDFRKDLMAGLAIGTVAVPLSMALAIATGVPPQHGLYTAIIAGALIALAGGSRFNVSGPTAAFVVILFPIVQQHGLGGLLIASMMAGVILLAMGIARMGLIIQFVPYPVILGFTAGIAVVIATLQIPDFLGLQTGQLGEHFVDNMTAIVTAIPSLNPLELAIGVFSLLIMLLWPRLGLPLPAPLMGLVVGALAAWLINRWLGGSPDLPAIQTITSRFTWEAQGMSGDGIPPIAPSFMAPWRLPGPDGQPLELSLGLLRELMAAAFAIAALGAIESLLCAVISDGMTKTRHDPNAELIGQGLGNLVAPLFARMTTTDALARTATSIRSGARAQIAAVIHSLVVLGAVVALTDLLGQVPMATLAALLLIVAWNMSGARSVIHTLRSAPLPDAAILVVCFGLTVVFDMVLAVTVGIALAAAHFVRRMAMVTVARRVNVPYQPQSEEVPADTAIYDINGPLFFGVANKTLTSLQLQDANVRTLILEMHGVPSMDMTAIASLQTFLDELHEQQIAVILSGLPPPLIVKLRRAGIRTTRASLTHTRDQAQAVRVAARWHQAREAAAPAVSTAPPHIS